MKYRNKALIYEMDSEKIIIDQFFNGYLEDYNYILIDTITLGEEIGNELFGDNNETSIGEIYKKIDHALNPVIDNLCDEIINYIERNDGTVHM